MASTPQIVALKRSRAALRGTLTRFALKIDNLEAREINSESLGQITTAQDKLGEIDSKFNDKHDEIIQALPEDDDIDNALDAEQATLEKHEQDVSSLSERLKLLSQKAHAHHYSTKFGGLIDDIADLVLAADAISDPATQGGRVDSLRDMLSPLQERLSSLRSQAERDCSDKQFHDLRHSIIAEASKRLRDLALTIGEMRSAKPTSDKSAPTGDPKRATAIKLAKLDAPTFGGDILQWQQFWSQFKIAIHSRSDLDPSQKMAYLCQSLKQGSAFAVIKGFSLTGDHYDEAISCLQQKYDRPRLLHLSHVKAFETLANSLSQTSTNMGEVCEQALSHWRALKLMKAESLSTFLTALFELHMTSEYRNEWRKEFDKEDSTPEFEKLLDFVQRRARAAESVYPLQRHAQKQATTKRESSNVVFNNSTPHRCPVCQGEHLTYQCQKFLNLSVSKRNELVKENKLCHNCLRAGHPTNQCRSAHRCRQCHKAHHTLLHFETLSSNAESFSPSAAATPANNAPTRSAAAPLTSANLVRDPNSRVILMTAQVLVHGPDGRFLRARALLDSGSTASFMTQKLAKSLNLELQPIDITVEGFGARPEKAPPKSYVSFKVSSVRDPHGTVHVSALAFPTVTSDIPIQPIPYDPRWNHLKGLPLADPHYGQPGRIDLLLGGEILSEIILPGWRVGEPYTPAAMLTKFGWVLTGRTNIVQSTVPKATTNHVVAPTLEQTLRKFWEIEEVPHSELSQTPGERYVVKHFAENHSQLDDGSFVVPLPKNAQAVPLGDSKAQARRRFLSLERSLHARGNFPAFQAVVNEYFDLKHAERVPQSDSHKPTSSVYYLPMHAVSKAESTTTKLRIVFDASAKSTSGSSLNDQFLVGPTLHSTLIDVLLRFRLHRIALTADISKMYRAVHLAPEDKDLHRFLWRDSPKDELVDYRMTRLTFGVSASSFAANQSIRQLATNHADQYPQAARVILQDFYVDDCVTGADSPSEAVHLQSQLQELLNQGNFLLRKWHSSDPDVLNSLPANLKDPGNQVYLDSDPATKALGILWNTNSDSLTVHVSPLPPQGQLTKRILVSDVSRTFDVLGWYSPTIILAKILLQKCWEEKVEWDEPVSLSISRDYPQWREELPLIGKHSIPRPYLSGPFQVRELQLHGFCDASESAYAAVLYIRATDDQGTVQTSLITSKTRVAPIKRQTIPRLELCGAVLLARLSSHVSKTLEVSFSHVYHWTDSTIVLSWLDGGPRRLKTFVANRISTITDLTPTESWRHVSSPQNPADCASRGIMPSTLLQHSLWWDGPDWLREPPDHWPSLRPAPMSVPEEERPTVCNLVSQSPDSDSNFPINFDTFSSFNKLLRVTAWVLRFIRRCKSKGHDPAHGNFLSAQELQDAENLLIRMVQKSQFSDLIDALKTKSAVSWSSPLRNLHPFLDSSDILRVGGRLHRMSLPTTARHPAILSARHPVVKLIIRSEHIRLLHGGPTLVASSLAQRYHILRGRPTIRSITHNCVVCRRQTRRTQNQVMGQLPPQRLEPQAVFTNVGIDFAGPITVKRGNPRKPVLTKAFVCVFVCLVTKAVHLEAVSDLGTDAFMAALKRFVARRGIPSNIYSDNGSNFRGAAAELREVYRLLDEPTTKQTLLEFSASQRIKWHFIPSLAPHFGGIWESAVKSFKTHFRRITREVRLNFEELSTTLTQIEACLNSRPLTALPDAEDSISVLTPGHFLISKPVTALPEVPQEEPKAIHLTKRWQLCQQITRHLWKRWTREYISTLNKMVKWHTPTRNYKTGDIVLYQGESSVASTKWPLARVTSVHPGEDGHVRAVTIFNGQHHLTRPVNKLVLLLDPASPSDSIC